MDIIEAIEMGERILAYHRRQAKDRYSNGRGDPDSEDKAKALAQLLHYAMKGLGIEPRKDGGKALKWSEEWPERPGWYWARWEMLMRGGEYTTPETVLIKSIDPVDGHFDMVVSNLERWEADERDGPILWCGPIDPPPLLPDELLVEPDLTFMDDEGNEYVEDWQGG